MIDSVESEVDLLARHLRILRLVVERGPIGIIALSNETGTPRHKVRYSLRVLEESGLVEPTSEGAVTTESTDDFLEGVADDVDDVIARLEDLTAETGAVTAEP